MASFTTNSGADGLQTGGSITWLSDTIMARLVLSSVTPTKDDTSMTGLTGVGTDVTLGSKTKTKNTTDDRIQYDAGDPTFTAVTTGSTVGWVVVYKFVTNDAGSTPIFVLDITDTPTNGGDISITFNASGIGYTQQ